MKLGGGHRRSGSMDGSNLPAGLFEAESPGPSSGSDYAKKALAPERLAELALIDPKRAKRCISLLFPCLSGFSAIILLLLCFYCNEDYII